MTHQDAEEKPDYAKLGRLTTLGPREAWQVALLLPLGFEHPGQYQDLRTVYDTFDAAPVGEDVAFRVRLVGSPETRFGPPRLRFRLEDRAGVQLTAIAYGVLEDLRDALRAPGELLVLGKLIVSDTGRFFSFIEVIPPVWAGRVRPRYAGKPNVIGGDKVRDRVFTHLRDAAPAAAAFIQGELAALEEPAKLLRAVCAPDLSLLELIKQAHLPPSPEAGFLAQRALERLAALVALWKANTNRPLAPLRQRRTLTTLQTRAQAAPFAITAEQHQAMAVLAASLQAPTAARAILSGDVGTGKTICYQAVLASFLDAGGRAVVLLPNFPMAQQAHADFTACYPDLPALQVTSDTDRTEDLTRCPVLFGTTALLHRPIGPRELVIVDEQQRFNVAQREAHVDDQTHLIEISATCIPRTQALVQYGIVQLATLREPHTPKTLHTRYWPADTRRELFRAVKDTLQRGDRAFIIYPARGDGAEDPDDIHNVRAAYGLWDRLFPGRVRALTGADRNEDKQATLEDMRQGRADLLICTSLIEVGVNVSRLRRLVVIGANHFGVTSLHQMRGRLAREGGEGHCDLFCPTPPSQDGQARIDKLCQTQDGFEIAEFDLRRRGFGDLARGAERQTGADETFLFGRPLGIDVVDEILPLYAALQKRGKNPPLPC